MAPAVGAVSSVTIGGNDVLAASISGVGLTPTLTWSAPVVGQADRYAVYLYEIYDDGVNARAQYRFVGSAFLTTPGLVVSPGLLAAGKSYVVRIDAERDPDGAGGTSPYRYSAQRGASVTWTQIISP